MRGVVLVAGLEILFYFLAGIGVRERSRLAAISAFVAYFLGCFVAQRYAGNGFNFIRMIALAMLAANIRGIWLSSLWAKANIPSEPPVRLNQTIFDLLSDQLPRRIWPITKWLLPFLAAIEIGLMLFLLTQPLPPKAL